MKILNKIDGAKQVLQDSNNRFVSDNQIANWDAKASTALATTSANGLMSSADKTKLNSVAANANNYTLPVAGTSLGGVKSGTDITVDASGNVSVNDDSHNHIISNVDGLQTALDGKVDDSQVLTNVPAGAKFTDTVYTHPTTSGNKHIPSGGASGQFLKWSADGTAVWAADNNTVYTHPANHPPSIITQDASNRFVTDAEKATWNAKANSSHALSTHSDVSTTAPTIGQVLKWNGTNWYPGIDANTTYIAGNGLSLTSTTFSLGIPGTLTASTGNETTSTSHKHEITTSSTGTSNTIMQTNSSGDSTARLFKSTYANQSTISGAMAFRINNSSDNSIRFCSDATAIRTFLSAGSLDGSIIERGSNTNGTYLKFGNGEMICYGYNTFVTPTSVANGPIFGHGTTAYRTNTFPATFYSAPSLDMMVHIGEAWCSLRTVSTTNFTWKYYAYATWTAGETKDFFWKAHGRWKA